jgi:hypothetical protein
MHPEIPTGRDAVRTWFALPRDARRAIAGANRSGRPADTPELAMAAAGYGATLDRWLGRVVMGGNVIVVVAVIVAAMLAGDPAKVLSTGGAIR